MAKPQDIHMKLAHAQVVEIPMERFMAAKSHSGKYDPYCQALKQLPEGKAVRIAIKEFDMEETAFIGGLKSAFKRITDGEGKLYCFRDGGYLFAWRKE